MIQSPHPTKIERGGYSAIVYIDGDLCVAEDDVGTVLKEDTDTTASLQAAVDLPPSDGMKVLVSDGLFPPMQSPVSLKSNLSLEGVGKGTILQGDGTFSLLKGLNIADVTIRNLQVKNCTYGIEFGHTSGNFRLYLENIYARYDVQTGIYLDYSFLVSLINCHMRHCSSHGLTINARGGGGLAILGGSYNSNGGNGINIEGDGCNSASINGAAVESNTQDGMSVILRNGVINGCYAEGNGRYSFAFVGNSHNVCMSGCYGKDKRAYINAPYCSIRNCELKGDDDTQSIQATAEADYFTLGQGKYAKTVEIANSIINFIDERHFSPKISFADLKHAFLMNEGTGATTTDSSRNGLVGTFMNSTSWAGGKFGNSVSFAHGTADYIDIGTITLATAGTIVVFANTGTLLADTWHSIFRFTKDANNYVWLRYKMQTEPYIQLYGKKGGSELRYYDTNLVLGDDTDYVFTFQWNNSEIKLKLDNIDCEKDQYIYQNPSNTYAANAEISNSDGGDKAWNGKIDALLLFDKVLTQLELDYLVQRMPTAFNF